MKKQRQMEAKVESQKRLEKAIYQVSMAQTMHLRTIPVLEMRAI